MIRFISILFFLFTFTNIAVAEIKTTYKVAIQVEDTVTKLIVEQLSKEWGITFEYLVFPDAQLKLEAVESGEADFSASVIYTKEHAERLSFSAPTNMEYTYFYSKDKMDYNNVEYVGVPIGSSLDELIREVYPHLKLSHYNDISEARAMLENNEVDGIVDTIQQLKYMALSGFYADLLSYQFPTKPVSVVTTKGKNLDILKRIETYLHQPNIQRFIRESSQAYQFDIQRQALRRKVLASGINLDRPYTVKIENYSPYGNYDERGNVTGIAADTVFEACDLMRLECVLESQANESWSSMYQSLRDKDIDILAPVANTKARNQSLTLSNDIYFPEAIVVKRKGYKEDVYRSISELIVERVGMVEGGIFESMMRKKLPESSIYSMPNAEQLLGALLADDIDYMVMTRTTYNHILRETRSLLPIAEDKMIGTFFSYGISVGFQNNEQGKMLTALFNDALHLLDLSSIVERYNYLPDWQQTLTDQKRFDNQSQSLFLLVIAILAGISYFWHKQSITDNLTKLKNRTALHRKYSDGLYKGQVIIYFDVNKFKLVNDQYGHKAGDEVLKRIADNIRKYWKYDSYRIGGDEFVLIGRETEDSIHDLLSKIGYFEFKSKDNDAVNISITVSYGYHVSQNNLTSLDDGMHLADTEMYKFKFA